MTAVLHETTALAPAAYPRDPTMAEDGLLRAHAKFPRQPDAVRDARHWLADTLGGWDVPDADVDIALVPLSEIATNAVKHAGGDSDTFRVEAWLRGVELKVSVYDPDPATDVSIPDQRGSAESGRGLILVKAMSAECGVKRTDDEKCVWYLLYIGEDT